MAVEAEGVRQGALEVSGVATASQTDREPPGDDPHRHRTDGRFVVRPHDPAIGAGRVIRFTRVQATPLTSRYGTVGQPRNVRLRVRQFPGERKVFALVGRTATSTGIGPPLGNPAMDQSPSQGVVPATDTHSISPTNSI